MFLLIMGELLPASDYTYRNFYGFQIGLSSTDSSQRVIAFEVCMSEEGSRNPKKAPPRLLAVSEGFCLLVIFLFMRLTAIPGS